MIGTNNWLENLDNIIVFDGNKDRSDNHNYSDWLKIIDDVINNSRNIPEVISSGSLEKWFGPPDYKL